VALRHVVSANNRGGIWGPISGTAVRGCLHGNCLCAVAVVILLGQVAPAGVPLELAPQGQA
jgi:hypothetical protein